MRTLVFALGLTFFCPEVPALPKGGPSPSFPAVVTVADSTGGWWLRVQSDTQGAYAGTSQVSSTISGGFWELTTYYRRRGSWTPSNRSAFFDLTEQVSEGSFPTPVSTAYLPVHLTAKCANEGVDMLSIPVGQSALCPGAFRFWTPSGLWYRFAFDPNNLPGVDRLKVTCTASDSTGCKTWTISPGGNTFTGADPNPKSLNRLLQIDENGNILAVGGDTTFRSRSPSPAERIVSPERNRVILSKFTFVFRQG